MLVTVASLRPPVAGFPIPAAPNFRVFQYGVFQDLDDDEGPVIMDGAPFWGMDGLAEDLADPRDIAVVVSVMEQDNGSRPSARSSSTSRPACHWRRRSA